MNAKVGVTGYWCENVTRLSGGIRQVVAMRLDETRRQSGEHTWTIEHQGAGCRDMRL